MARHIFAGISVLFGSTMASYRAQPTRPDRAKAMVAVVAVHAVLGAMLLVRPAAVPVSQDVPPTVLIDIVEQPPPEPPPEPLDSRAKQEEGAAGRKAEPTPVVAPKPLIVVPAKPPIIAAPVAGSGASPTAGASTAGTGPGAGGTGSGRGGGGSGDFSGYTPARLIQNVRRGDYRALASGRLPSGSAMVSLRIRPDGLAEGCRIVRSSGDPLVDSGLCPLLTQRLRFRPALDDARRPIPYSLQYVATWTL
jgi:protein TonB